MRRVASDQMGQQPAAQTATTFLGLSRPMALILFTVFLDLLGIGLIFPIGPFYASAFGASAFDVGLLFTLFSVAQFLTIPRTRSFGLPGAAVSVGFLSGPALGGFWVSTTFAAGSG